MKLRVGALRHYPTVPASSGASLRLLDLATYMHFHALTQFARVVSIGVLGQFQRDFVPFAEAERDPVASELRLRSEQARFDRLWLSGASSQCKPPSDIRQFTENSRA